MAKTARQKKKSPRKRRKKVESSKLIDNLDPFEVSDTLKLSIYGTSGSGKTTLWSSFPGPILAILCSGGKGTNELDSVAKEDRSKIKAHYLTDTEELLQIAEELEDDTYYETVVIDHLSGIQDLRIAEILGLDEIPVQKEWGMATRSQYGERALNMKTYIRSFMDLKNKNVVFVSQETMNDPGQDHELDILPSIEPALSDSVLEWFNPACNNIIRTFIKQKTITKKVAVKRRGKKVGTKEVTETVKDEYEYCAMVGPSDVYRTKLRAPKGMEKPVYIVDPTYSSLMEAIGKAPF